jgi:DNA polymerase-3 subunit gamma/tau
MRFDEVVGQDHVTRTLKNAIQAGRLAHAYLFTGQRGCGKTTVARILAKAINCPNAPTNGFEPCNKCPICISITEGRSMDVSEIDGASNNGVDDVRTLRDNVKYPPLEGSHKVVIIDEVHMLSTSAFNALLKTLEEPPKYLVFIFATTEVQKVLPTILSRTQRYDFRRIQLDEIVKQLRHIADSDKIAIDDDALLIIAKKADGSMRDAQSVFDQVVAYCGSTVDTNLVRSSLSLIDTDFYFDVSDSIADRSAKGAFEISHHVISRGYDIEEFFIGLLEHFRNILTAVVTQDAKLIEVSKVHQERYLTVAKDFSEGDLIRLIRIGQTAMERLKSAQQPRIMMEVALVEMMLLERAMELQSLLESIEQLRSGTPASAVSASANLSRGQATGRSEAPSRITTSSERTADSPTIPNEPVVASMKAAPRKSADPIPAEENASDGSIDYEIVRSQWPQFIDSVQSKSKSLHASMPMVELCGVRRATVYLSSGDDHTMDVLAKFKTTVVEALREFFASSTLLCEIGPREIMLARSGMPLLSAAEIAKSQPTVAKPQRQLLEIEEELLAMGAREV